MNKILEVKFGSHLYGTDTPNSDLDFKGIYLPTAKEICLHSYQKTITTSRPKREFERNTKDDVDIEFFSLDRYLDLLVQGQTVALDMLFHPLFTNHWVTSTIYNNRFELLNRNVNSFVGYAKQQAAKYGVKGFRVAALRSSLEFLDRLNPYSKLNENIVEINDFVYAFADLENQLVKHVDCKAPNGRLEPHLEICNRKFPLHAKVKYVKEIIQKLFDEYGHRALLAEKNEGIDWKALSHAVRVNSEAQELLKTGFITFPRPDKDLLLNIKTGKLDYKEVAVIIKEGLEGLKKAQEQSILKEAPNKEWADNFVYETYSEIVKNA